MLYIVGTQKEAENLKGLLPNEVFEEVSKIAKILDDNYGADRDVFEEDGGYICIVENDTDVAELNSMKWIYQKSPQSFVPSFQMDG